MDLRASHIKQKSLLMTSLIVFLALTDPVRVTLAMRYVSFLEDFQQNL
mgnify:CR=1 FL=1